MNPFITRRVFLGGVGLTAAGLFFGLYQYNKNDKNPFENYTALNPADDPAFHGLSPNVFIHIAPITGLVSIVCHRSEMGQGIRSSLPVLLADELGADMDKVKIIQGEGNIAYGDQNTDGSSSIRGVYSKMRQVAATARMMLVSAAALKMNFKEEELYTENNFVIHKPSGKKLDFAELAIAAGELAIPTLDQVVLRPIEELQRVGKPMPLLDGPNYVAGKAIYAADVQVENMLIAVVARPPVLGSKVKDYNDAAAFKVAGVKKIVKLPHPEEPYAFQPFGGVAVIAENTWAAMKGRDALKIEWEIPEEHAKYDSKEYRKQLEATVEQIGVIERNVGDVETALSRAKKVVEANYYVPHIPHLTMEPPAALAHFRSENGGSCEVWACTQNPQTTKTEVARITGLSEDRVLIHVTMLGGGFGRKSKADFSSEAAFLSKSVGHPVRVQWTRTDDIHNDYLDTVSAQKLSAGIDSKNNVIAWRHRTAFPPIATTFAPKAQTPGASELQQGVLDVALNIPNVRAEAGKAIQHTRIGWLRSVYNIFHAFAVNCFIDEIAEARGKGPLENMLEIYGPAKNHSLDDLGIKKLSNYGASLDAQPVDGKRLHDVLKRVVKLSGWDGRSQSKGIGFGLAAHRSFNSYAAVVASVRAASTSNEFPDVDEVWISLDAGQIINPDRVHAQLEGSVINGLSHILYEGVTFKEGRVEQNNFDSAQQVRNKIAPRKIHTDIFITEHLHGGVGEPGVPPVAPAIANAVFALTGKRVREFGLGAKGLNG